MNAACALAWIIYREREAVEMVRSASDSRFGTIPRGRPESRLLLGEPFGVVTMDSPDGMAAGMGCGAATQVLVEAFRGGHVYVEGRRDGVGDFECVPPAFWRSGAVAWRDLTGHYDQWCERLCLTTRDGSLFCHLHIAMSDVWAKFPAGGGQLEACA
jgi:hypothetical protein